MRLNKSDNIIFWLAALFSLPFLLNAELFKDDLYRAASGDPSYWDKDSRPLTTILMKVLNLGNMITDVSPLSFILGMVCMVISALIISRAISSDKPSYSSSAFASLIFLNPMFIGNAVFSFDSATMGASIALAIASSYFYSNTKYIDIVWKTVAVTSIMSMYQPSSALFVTMTALTVIVKILENKRNYIQDAILNAISFVSGFIIYTHVVQRFYPPNEYALRNSQFIDFNNGILNGLNEAFSRNLAPVIGSMPSIVKTALVIAIAISVACIIKYAFSREYKIHDRLLLVFSFAFSLMMFSGFSLAVKSDYVMPRVLMSLGLTLCLVFFLAQRLIGFKKISYLAYVIFVANSMNISYSFNNAIKHQNEFDSVLLTSISSALHQNGIDVIDNIDIIGWQPLSPATKVAFRKYPFFKTIMPQYLSNTWGLGAVAPYYDITFKNRLYNNIDLKEKVFKNGIKIFTSCSIDVIADQKDVIFDYTNKC
ncbi:glucosyltransferase domain-containing protein [Escherichia coli]